MLKTTMHYNRCWGIYSMLNPETTYNSSRTHATCGVFATAQHRETPIICNQSQLFFFSPNHILQHAFDMNVMMGCLHPTFNVLLQDAF